LGTLFLPERRKVGKDTHVKKPRITLTCDCGASGLAAYGETWTCPECGKSYDTSSIPSADYEEILSLDRRYRLAGFAVVGVLAILVLVVALTGQTISIFAGLAVALLSWFLYFKPLVHRKHKKSVAKLTRSWELEAQ
jgi:hypothetical protein